MFTHIIVYGGLGSFYAGLASRIEDLGDIAVFVFILISGFVITHLLLETREPYGTYICRRFLRIYPVYLVCLILGLFTTHLYFRTFMSEPWGAQAPLNRWAAVQLQNQTEDHFLPNLLAHLIMLHGAVPYEWIRQAPMAFLSPGWSLSLEWQFYLMAPLILWGIRRGPSSRLATAIIAGVSFWAFRIGFFGVFTLPSFLPGAAPFFAVGIASRILIPNLPKMYAFPFATVIIAFAVLTWSADTHQISLFIWMFFIIWMQLIRPSDPVGERTASIFDLLLESSVARYLGRLSYPIYLVHMPVIQAIVYLCVQGLHFGIVRTSIATLVATPILTLLLSIALHRFLEVPFINFGKSISIKPMYKHTQDALP